MAEGPPQVPQSEDPKDTGFTPQPMTGWFTPSELIRAGVKSLLSSLFGAYADRRETQAALREQGPFDYSDKGELWLDYVADTGDGFDSTYAIARLLAEKELRLTLDGTTWSTRRGDLLLFGGDEVYPTATSEEYRNRLIGPYRAAFPWGPHQEAPHVFAIPGNHDWYDGLTSFTRLFCQEWRWVGGWKTKQSRSYFALKLRKDLWLWGIDVQLGSDVDEPQIKYFQKIANDEEKMAEGSSIILITAEPAWVYTELKGPEAYRNLALFERETMQRRGHRVVVGLSGDLHSYARYEEEGGKAQRFVAGGGGAYLFPTHDLPAKLTLPGVEKQPPTQYTRERVYPAAKTSKKLTLGSLFFPLKNLSFSLFLGLAYLFYAWVWQSASFVGGGASENLLKQLAELNLEVTKLEHIFGILLRSIAHSPQSIILLLALTLGLVAFADCKSMLRRIPLGGLHAGAHLGVLLFSMWLFAFLTLHPDRLHWRLGSWQQILVFGLGMVAVGGFVGGTVMGLYFFLANLRGHHTNEVFSCQSIPDYKHFLRLHVGSDGKLTIYPIGIDRVPRRRRRGWRLNREAGAGQPWFEPAHGSIGELARLIEEPIEIPLSSSS